MIRTSLNTSVLVTALLLFGADQGPARKHEHYGQGFSIDLTQSYDEVRDVVRQITRDGIIRGTYQYRGTNQLDGAEPASKCNAFSPWTGLGEVLYKIRPHTLAPEHFYQSSDEGTVAVRYIVQPLAPSGTRLRIDAIFIEATRRTRHASDGRVEDSEFEAISDTMKEIEDAEGKKREKLLSEQQQHQLEELQTQLDRETEQLKEVIAKEQRLEQQIQQQQGLHAARVKTSSADLKAQPYNQAKTIRLLSEREELTVLLETPAWLRVQTAGGEQGWVYRLMLEVSQ
jgi:hypothetical protein